MIFFGIIISIILFSLIVLVHEWGHFKSARFFGVKVEEFGLGIPPRAKKLFVDKKGTIFSLNWLPIGGFVKLTGENPNSYLLYDKNKKLYKNDDLESDIKLGRDIFLKNGQKLTTLEKEQILKGLDENKASYNLMNKKTRQQGIIILAGIFMNFLLAFFIFFVLFLVGVRPLGINDKIKTNLDLKLIPSLEQAFNDGILEKSDGFVISPVKGSFAESSGLKSGDVILKLNNKEIDNTSNFVKNIGNNSGKEITISGYRLNPDYKKGCKCIEKEDFKMKLKVPETGKIGIYIGENITVNEDFRYKYSFLESGKMAFLETKNQIIFTFEGLSYLFEKVFFPKTEIERKEAISGISGPIGIVSVVSQTFTAGIIFTLSLGALISISLGVFNLLPIPALDGGRFIFIVINGFLGKLFGRKLFSENLEAVIHFSFFIILIALSIFIGYNDISKIINN